MRVQVQVEPARGRPAAVLRFRLTDETGTAVTDLEPYLGSAGHLLVVSPDLTHSIHAHPDAPGSGPELAFDVEFPEAGIYKLWVQIQRRGKVSAVPFVVRIGVLIGEESRELNKRARSQGGKLEFLLISWPSCFLPAWPSWSGAPIFSSTRHSAPPSTRRRLPRGRAIGDSSQ